MRTFPSPAASALLLVLLPAVGCRVGPDYETPELAERTDPPWRAPSGPEITAEREELARWWERFESPELAHLSTSLCAQNLSLAEARQRIVAARAQRGVVDAERLPRVDGTATYQRAGTGERSLNFQGPPPGQDVSVYSLGVTAAWELDLWGRVARLVEAADAEIDVAVEDYRAAAVSLLAELALAYVDARTLGERLEVLQHNIELEQQTAELARSRFEAGNGARIDFDQAQRELEVSRARVPDLQAARRSAENRIAILVGERPRDGLVEARGALALPPAIGRGLPADLLERRADVRRAERALAAAVARIGAAEAERYPSLSIDGTLALAARDLDALTSGADALSYSIGPALRVPLFTGGRIDSAVHFREAGAEQSRLAFERTLLEAVGEVEDASEGVVRTRERVERLGAAADAARGAEQLAHELYDSGLRDLLQLVDAQRARVEIEDQLLVSRQAALGRTIDLYRALGGGWDAVELDGSLREEPLARAESAQ